ncbi:hypothetical protein LTS10_009414 [Elasticomyces elasticus]|nr:hypothetical protein LTS10_009414 [Elasticomyces elasticus]
MANLSDVGCSVDVFSPVTGDIVEVILGPEQRKFYVHDKLLCSQSKFFEAALKKEWIKGQARIVELPEDGALLFERYVQWLYGGRLAVKKPNGQTDYDMLAGLYVFGEKIVDQIFQDKVIDALVAATRNKVHPRQDRLAALFPYGDTVDRIYNGTPRGSPARRLMVDMHAIRGKASWLNSENLERNNHEFIVDLALAMYEQRTVREGGRLAHKNLDTGVPCSYHKHGKDETCPGKAD